MLVILTENQILSPDVVCQGCLLADQQGHPRWKKGKLRCGHIIHTRVKENLDPCNASQSIQSIPTPQYQCQMGFRVTDIS